MATTKNTLTKSDYFYIEHHFADKSVADIAKDLQKPAKLVQAYVDKLVDSDFEQPKKEKKSNLEKAGIVVSKSGAVCMTEAGSIKGDESGGVSYKTESDKEKGVKRERNKNFFDKRVSNGIHVIDPEKPVM